MDLAIAEFASAECYLVLTLEFGLDVIEKYPNTCAVPTVHKKTSKKAHLGSGIHTIVRTYSKGSSLVSTTCWKISPASGTRTCT